MLLSIADLIIDIKKNNKLLLSQSSAYLYNGSRRADFEVDFDSDYMSRETAAEKKEGLDYPPYLSEYLAIYRKLCTEIINYDAFLMHASVIADNGVAYAFTAPSGTGKSTHARLWRESFTDCIMVNDDKPVIRLINGTPHACGTPWCGKHNLSTNVCLPLGGIGIIERATENSVVKVSPASELTMLLNQINRPREAELMFKTIELFNRMLETVPLYRIKCDISPEAAIISHSVLTGNHGSEKA